MQTERLKVCTQRDSYCRSHTTHATDNRATDYFGHSFGLFPPKRIKQSREYLRPEGACGMDAFLLAIAQNLDLRLQLVTLRRRLVQRVSADLIDSDDARVHAVGRLGQRACERHDSAWNVQLCYSTCALHLCWTVTGTCTLRTRASRDVLVSLLQLSGLPRRHKASRLRDVSKPPSMSTPSSDIYNAIVK